MKKSGATNPSLRANIAYAFIGSLVYAASQWGLLVVLNWAGSAALVGRFCLALAVTTPIMLLADLNLRSVQASDACKRFRFSDYVGLRFCTTLTALGAVALVALTSPYPGEAKWVILAVGLARAIETFSDVTYGRMQQWERMDLIARSFVLRGILSLVAMGATVVLTGSVLCGTLALALTWLVVLVTHDLVCVRRLGEEPFAPSFQLGRLFSLLWLAFPAGLVIAASSLQWNLPRYFLESWFGEADLGIFAAIAYVVVASQLLIRSVNQSALPRLARYFQSGAVAKFRQLLVRLIIVGAGWGIAGLFAVLLVGRPFLRIAYGSAYAEHAAILVWLSAGMAVRFAMNPVAAACRAVQRFWLLAVAQGLAILATLASCMILIPRFGILGAAWSTVLGMLIEALAFTAICVWLVRYVARSLPRGRVAGVERR